MDAKKLAIGVVALAIIGFAAIKLVGSPKNETAVTSGMQVETQTESTTNGTSESKDVVMKEDTSAEASNYKDGTYSATGVYDAPPGEEKIDVTVTLVDGVITESSLEKLGKHEVSKKMQAAFESGYEELVIGKNIDEIDLDVVAGSSLTPIGFENALEQIRAEAQS